MNAASEIRPTFPTLSPEPPDSTQQDLVHDGIALVLVHVEGDLQADLDRHRLSDVIGRRCIFATRHEALAGIEYR